MAAAELRLRLPCVAAAGALLVAGAASAQTMNANSAAYNAGWGRTADQENQPVNPSLRDANGNLTAVNGIITSSASQSMFSGGASTSTAGAAFGGATAIGNSLTVVTQGNNNTVVVDSVQTNSGAVSATSGSGNGS